MTDMDLRGKRALIREDFNVPMENGHITNDARLKAAIPTIEMALQQGAGVILLSHLGRPKEGKTDPAFSLAPVADNLSQLLNKPITFEADWLNGVNIKPGKVVLCENVRFNLGEKSNDDDLSKKLAALCDIFVMDAFGTAHRAHASTCGVAKYAPTACAGPLLMKEITALTKALENPKAPVVAIVGGSKVSTKLTVLKALIKKVDHLIVGGGIANTFLAAVGHPVGKSLHESNMLAEANQLLDLAKDHHVSIPLPMDVMVATEFASSATPHLRHLQEVADNEMILDIGPGSARAFSKILQQAGTIIWNGPVGVFEFDAFSEGTRTLANAIASSPAFSIAGGGDTLAAIDKFGITEQISYISTGGGAFLEFMEGKSLPSIAVLQKKK